MVTLSDDVGIVDNPQQSRSVVCREALGREDRRILLAYSRRMRQRFLEAFLTILAVRVLAPCEKLLSRVHLCFGYLYRLLVTTIEAFHKHWALSAFLLLSLSAATRRVIVCLPCLARQPRPRSSSGLSSFLHLAWLIP